MIEKNIVTLQEALAAYHAFLVDFETLFHNDDGMTYLSFAQGETLDLEAAIAAPDQFDGDNWANRDNLLRSYGRQKRLLGETEDALQYCVGCSGGFANATGQTIAPGANERNSI